MPPIPQPELASMDMPPMSLADYIRFARTILQGGGPEHFKQHFKIFGEVGEIVAFYESMMESGVDPSSLVKRGMPQSEWCGDFTFHALNDIGVPMAQRVNKMIESKALIVVPAAILGPQFLAACEDVMKDETHFLKACNAVLESKTRFFGACKLMMENKIRFLAACEKILETKTWYRSPFEAMSEIKTRFLKACENSPETKTWISVVCQFVTGHKKIWFGLMVSVIAVGVMLRKGQRRGGRNVLESGDIEDDYDNDIDRLDARKTEAGDDGDESGAHSAPKAPPPWARGHIGPGRKNQHISPRGKVLYRVTVNNKAKWFRADQVKFEDAKTFHGHDLRKRIRVKVKV